MPRPGHAPHEKAKDFKGSMKRLIKNLSKWKFIMIMALVLALTGAILALMAPHKLSEFADTISAGLVPNTEKLTQITEKGTDQIYNYVTQIQAAEQAQNMYNSNKFTSDLMNSYAWDTATLFLQTCGNNTKYSQKTSVNSGSLATTGTNNQLSKDVQCNVYDMASNVMELTTETSNYSYGGYSNPCVSRGGDYHNYNSTYTSLRIFGSTSSSGITYGFRPLLYL